MAVTTQTAISRPLGLDSDACRSPSRAPRRLWLGLYFPQLALETHDRNDARPLRAIVDQDNRICTVSPAARAAAIKPGMPAPAARALCKTLQLLDRNREQETRALERLARVCSQFTPTVSLDFPDAVLLEVQASLRLFGGLASLRQHLQTTLAPLNYTYYWAVAPTSAASLILARHKRSIVIQDPAALRSALGKLAINNLDLDHKLLTRLHRTGLRRLRDLWRLPRDGLARRYGPELVTRLDRILGKQPDPRAIYQLPPRFSATLELPTATTNHARILASAEELLCQLGGFLRRRDAGTTAVCVRLCHARTLTTPVYIGTRHNTRDTKHLLHLFDQSIQYRRLPAPVIRIELVSTRIQAFTPLRPALFRDIAAEAHDWRQTLEELEARLGDRCIRTLTALADHRPEYAWAYQTPNAGHSRVQQRPLWLLHRPRPLAQRRGQPWYEGRLMFQGGPERIESGWWEGKDQRRDYYIAVNSNGARLWVFRDLKRRVHTWYLHGLFG